MTAAKTEPTVMVPLAGRDIEVRKPSDGALVVLARVSRGIPRTDFDPAKVTPEERDRLIRNLGTLGKIIDGMIVKDEDRDWLDDVMVSGEVSAPEVFGLVAKAGELFNGQTAPAKKAAPPVRRRR